MTSSISEAFRDDQTTFNLLESLPNDLDRLNVCLEVISYGVDNEALEEVLEVATKLSKSVGSIFRDAPFDVIVENLTNRGDITKAKEVANLAFNKSKQFLGIVERLAVKGQISEAYKIVNDNSNSFDESDKKKALTFIAKELVEDTKTREEGIKLACHNPLFPELEILSRAAFKYAAENNLEAAMTVAKIIDNAEAEAEKIVPKTACKKRLRYQYVLTHIVWGLGSVGLHEKAERIRKQIFEDYLKEDCVRHEPKEFNARRINFRIDDGIAPTPEAPPPPFPKLPT